MAKSALAGEMRTRITIKGMKAGTDKEGNPTETLTDLFGGKVWCKWVYAHGAEVYEGMRLDLGQLATITMRYSRLLNQRCKIWHENDDPNDEALAWEIVSINDPEDKHKFLDIELRRTVVA